VFVISDGIKASLLSSDAVRPLAALLLSGTQQARLHAAWALMLLLCTAAANGMRSALRFLLECGLSLALL
jgi:hypothetical protein